LANADYSDMARAGGLMAYAPVIIHHHEVAAGYFDKISRGAKPAICPFNSRQILNWSSTRRLPKPSAIGNTVPQSVLLRMDEVIQ